MIGVPSLARPWASSVSGWVCGRLGVQVWVAVLMVRCPCAGLSAGLSGPASTTPGRAVSTVRSGTALQPGSSSNGSEATTTWSGRQR